MTNGHAASLLFGLTSSMSMSAPVIPNGVGYNHTQVSHNPSSSSNSNSSTSTTSRHRKSVESKEGASLASGGKNNSFHANHISLNNNAKDRSCDNSSGYEHHHDKDSPKQNHYQLSAAYDDAFGKAPPPTDPKSSKIQQNGNLQHYKHDYELPPQSMCQTTKTTEQTEQLATHEKERTKSGRKSRGNKGHKNAGVPADNGASSSSSSTTSKDNQTSSSSNTQHAEAFFHVVCNNKDHVGKVCESCPKFEVEVKKLKSEVHSLKQSENELRQKCESNATSVKACLQAKQKENDELHTK